MKLNNQAMPGIILGYSIMKYSWTDLYLGIYIKRESMNRVYRTYALTIL